MDVVRNLPGFQTSGHSFKHILAVCFLQDAVSLAAALHANQEMRTTRVTARVEKGPHSVRQGTQHTAGVLLNRPYVKVKGKVTWSCLTLCDPMDYTVHGILQARILEWVAFPFSRGSSHPRDQTQLNHQGSLALFESTPKSFFLLKIFFFNVDLFFF